MALSEIVTREQLILRRILVDAYGEDYAKVLAKKKLLKNDESEIDDIRYLENRFRIKLLPYYRE